MTRDDFRTLYAYNEWANDRLISMLYRIFGEETDLRQASEEHIRAIQETAVHIIAAQAIWRTRWQGRSPRTMLDPQECPTPLALRTAYGAERARFWAFFDTLDSDEALQQEIAYATTTGEAHRQPLWQMLQHVLTHSAYHRGQVTARLLDLGHEDALVSMDLITFYRDR
jgi:uncharacterized damage-inducible protein DinB